MSLFQKITDAILGKKPEKNPAPSAAAPPRSAPTPARAPQPAPANPVTAAPVSPTPISDIDVAARLSAMHNSETLNWRSSIVDLLKLLDIDASFANRKELAGELGDPNYSGTAEENIALHKRVMRELAKNGGKVPAELID
jgi:3-oxoacyl-ACP reductase-like protein